MAKCDQFTHRGRCKANQYQQDRVHGVKNLAVITTFNFQRLNVGEDRYSVVCDFHI